VFEVEKARAWGGGRMWCAMNAALDDPRQSLTLRQPSVPLSQK
jgi:hypothetical protein